MIRRVQALMDRGATIRLENEDGLRCVWIWLRSTSRVPDVLCRGKRETLEAALADALDEADAEVERGRKS